MAWSGPSRSLLCLVLCVVASSFCSCNPLTRLKALGVLKENLMISQGGTRHGRLLIGQNTLQGSQVNGTSTTIELLDLDADYQADNGWAKPLWAKGQVDYSKSTKPDNAAVEQLLKLEPKVECTGDSMKLQIQDTASTPGSLFLVDRGSNLSPLALSKLPQSCGYTVQSTRRDFVLVAPYDGCFVAQEEDCYVLPLKWCGVPLRMSCPRIRPSAPNPPMVTCHSEGMVVKTEWISVAETKVNLNDVWEPLTRASAKCGFSIVEHPEGVVFSVPFVPCLKEKDGLFTLELAGNGETKISCPSLSATEPTKSPPNDPQTKMPIKGVHPSTQSRKPAVDHTFPQKPKVPQKQPTGRPKDVAPPQVPYYQSFPRFFNPFSDNKPVTTAQPLPSFTKKTLVQSKQTVQPPNLPVAPDGQVPQQFFPFYVWPTQPEQVPVEKDTPVDSPATKSPNDEEKKPFLHFLNNLKPPSYIPIQAPELPATTSSPAVQTVKGHIKHNYFPFTYGLNPPKHETPAMQSPVTRPPPGKYPEYFLPGNHPSGPTQKHQEPPTSKPVKQENEPKPAPPVPQEPWGPGNQLFYQYPLWPQGSHQPMMPSTQQTPTLAPKGQGNPSPLNPPAGKVQQLHYPFYQKGPEKEPGEKPQPPEEPSAETLSKKPVLTDPPPAVNHPEGNVYNPFNLYYPQQPQAMTLPPAASTQKQQPNHDHSNGGKVHPGPQPGSPYMPPIQCPQFCPSGVPNCCPQIAFHQHMHHFVPPGHDSKNAPPFYPALPYLSSLAYSGLGSGAADPSPEPTLATTVTATQVPTTATSLPHSLPSVNQQLQYLLPPDGDDTAPVLSIPTNQKPTYPYLLPNLYSPGKLQQSQSSVDYNAPSKPQAPDNEEVNPLHIKSQVRQILSGALKKPSWSDVMSFVGQYRQRPMGNQQEESRAEELHPFNMDPSDSKEPKRAKAKSKVDHFLIPYSLLQDPRAPSANSSQQFDDALKESTNHDQTIQPNAQGKSYTLLQQGPPGRERNSNNEDLLAETTLQSQDLKPHHDLNSKPQNPYSPPFISAEDGSHVASLPKDSLNAANINPKFLERLWKLGGLLGNNQRIPAPVPGDEFQRWRSEADQRT